MKIRDTLLRGADSKDTEKKIKEDEKVVVEEV